MVCVRCGARNSEVAPVCEHCGAVLKKQSDASALKEMPGQPLATWSGEVVARPFDELPTAHVSSAADVSKRAPAAQMPFGMVFPLELEVSSPLQTRSDAERAFAASVSPLVSPPQPSAAPPMDGPQPLFPDVATYPTRANIQVPPDTSLALPRPADMAFSEASPSLSSATLAPSPLPFRPGGMLSLPSRAKGGSLLSRAGLNTPPGVATLGQIQIHTPPSQPGVSLPPGTSRSPGQERRGLSPAQPGLNTPRPPLEIYAASPQMGTDFAGPFQNDLNGSPLWSRMATPPQPMEEAGQDWQGYAGEEINRLVRPLPRWGSLGGSIAGIVLLVGLTFFNPDWATGALVAALVAVILAILVGIAAGVRVALGMLKETNPHRRSQVISTALLILLLLLLSSLGVSQQYRLHMVQGRYFEGQQKWAAAIAEYQTAGEKSNASVDVARVYDEWGEEQSRHQQYAGAVVSFSMVIQYYQQASKEFKRAGDDIVPAYLGWADQASQQQDYAGATNHYDALLALAFCRASCRQLALPKDATAYYRLAEQKLSQHQYVQAVGAYQVLTMRFPDAPETGQIHAHYAQALLGKGQQQLNTACSDALTTYRLLATLFADTEEGRQAATALTKPVSVTGRFTQSIPGLPNHPTAFLVQGLVAGIQQFQFPPLLAHAPAATIQSDGSFTFPSVPQGTYELVWSSDALHFYYASSGKEVLYTAHLGPLCTYNYGNINQAIPTK